QRLGIDWGIWTEDDVNRQLLRSIMLFEDYYEPAKVGINEEMIEFVAHELTRRVINSPTPLYILADSCDAEFDMIKGTALRVAKYLLAHHIWQIPIDSQFDPNQPVVLLNTSHLG